MAKKAKNTFIKRLIEKTHTAGNRYTTKDVVSCFPKKDQKVFKDLAKRIGGEKTITHSEIMPIVESLYK